MNIRKQLTLNSRPREETRYTYFPMRYAWFRFEEHNIETEIDQTSQAPNIEFQTQRRASDYLFSNGMHLTSLYKNTT